MMVSKMLCNRKIESWESISALLSKWNMLNKVSNRISIIDSNIFLHSFFVINNQSTILQEEQKKIT